MPIPHIVQPALLPVGSGLRLRRYDGVCSFALAWYQDEETLRMVDGGGPPYDIARLERMYAYLDAQSELYWIEAEEAGVYRPIGDVAFWQMDLPIVIGEKRWRGRGVGRQVVAALLARGRALSYPQLYVREIYDWNIPSQRLFTGAGFRPCEKTPRGARYCLLL